MAACFAFDGSEPYVGHVLAFVDCHALALGADGWGALGPGSTWGMALTGLLTIFVALIGYRLLLGGRLGLRDGVWLAARLGIVLALSTQWAAWHVLVFDVVTKGPDELASALLLPSGLGGQDQRGLAARVQGVTEAIDAYVHPAVASLTSGAATAPGAGGNLGAGNAGAGAQMASPPGLQTLPIEAAKPVAQAGRMLLVSTLTGLLAVRLTLALLLALGPIFIGFLLFETTWGFFASWARVLVGVALGAVAVPAVLALELAVIEPQVMALGKALDGNEALGMMPDEIWASAAVFGLVMLAAVLGVVRAAAGFSLPVGGRSESARVTQAASVSGNRAMQAEAGNAAPPPEERSRAHHIADAALAMERRDERVQFAETRTGQLAAARELPDQSGPVPAFAQVPLGQQGRRHHQRLSGVANRRDGR